jgi:ribosomal protein S18 acetylase RimI-like enzyme
MSSPAATVRRFTEADWNILRDLRLAALADSPRALLGDARQEAARPAEAWREMAGRETWFGAFVTDHPTDPTGQPVGLAALVQDAPTGHHYVESMWVRPGRRGRGLARILLDAAVNHVAELDGTTLRLWVLAGNPSAVLVYTRHGFRPTGRRQPVPAHPEVIEEEFVIDVTVSTPASTQSTMRGTTMRSPAAGTGSSISLRTSLRIP